MTITDARVKLVMQRASVAWWLAAPRVFCGQSRSVKFSLLSSNCPPSSIMNRGNYDIVSTLLWNVCPTDTVTDMLLCSKLRYVGVYYSRRGSKARFPLPEFTARVQGPSWRPVNSGAFLTPELTARVDGCQKCTRVDSVIETEFGAF